MEPEGCERDPSRWPYSCRAGGDEREGQPELPREIEAGEGHELHQDHDSEGQTARRASPASAGSARRPTTVAINLTRSKGVSEGQSGGETQQGARVTRRLSPHSEQTPYSLTNPPARAIRVAAR